MKEMQGIVSVQKWFRKDVLIILVLVGILLFIIALPVDDGKEEAETKGSSNTAQSGLGGLAAEGSLGGRMAGAIEADAASDEDYCLYLEERLREALSKMADVGEVTVMITLKASRELVVEKEQPVNQSSTKETDAQGGSRDVNDLIAEENTVYSTDGSASEPYVIKTLAPEIEGVLVVAQGAGSGTVNRTIAEIVQTLFGVEAHKVKVVKMDAGTGQ